MTSTAEFHTSPLDCKDQPKVINHVFAVQRSGHHAVMTWLQDCYGTAQLSSTLENDAYHGHLKGARYESIDRSPQEIAQRAVRSTVLFVNYEDAPYADRQIIPPYQELQSNQTGARTNDIIIVRDWFGMLASRIRSIHEARQTGKPLQLHDIDWDTLAGIWADHARAAADNPLSSIRYNHWFSDRSYRQGVAARYNVPNNEQGLGKVPEFGNGSSFHGLTFDGRARSMNVLGRWRDLQGEEASDFLEVATSYPLVDELNRELFGFNSASVVTALAAAR